MRVETINIDGLEVDAINNILKFNLMNGWIFLGYGMAKVRMVYSADAETRYVEVPIMSFKHDDWTEETEFFER